MKGIFYQQLALDLLGQKIYNLYGKPSLKQSIFHYGRQGSASPYHKYK
jgi:hypothetical protein